MGKIPNDENVRLRNKTKACMIEDHGSIVCIDASIPLLSLIGRRYTMMVLGVIGNKGNRKNFNEILMDIPHSSSTIISKRLKELQDFRLINRNESADGVTYSLSSFGQNVRERLLPLFHMIEDLSIE
jgi:DNA-binding HxlR family transcriptional regulator